MDALATADVVLFEGFRLDRSGLSKRDQSGTFVPVPIGSRALEVLGVLVGRSGHLVSRDEIMDAVWPGTVVENSNLPVQIAALRRVLDEGRENGSCIQTIPGRGYRLAVPVTRVESCARPAPGEPSANGAGDPVAEQPEPLHPATPRRSGAKPLMLPPRSRKWPWLGTLAIAAGALCLIAAVAAALNRYPALSGVIGPASRLSIVVLPFTNLGDDHDQQNLANAITDDLTADLSLSSDILVTSGNTAFTYRNRLPGTKQIGRELGVRYVLEGSVQRSGNRLRVNVQLIDAEKDAQLWAERLDRDADDLFALQNEIASQLANTLGVELIAAEAARPSEHPDALDYILRARAADAKGASREHYAEAIGLFERALATDPQSVEAQSRLALGLISRLLNNMTDSEPADLARANLLVGQALAASPRSPIAHFAKAQILRAMRRCREAMPEYETALAFNRVAALANIGLCKTFVGPIEEVIPTHEQAIRLSPRDPRLPFWYFHIGEAQQLQSRNDEAILWFEKARAANPLLWYPHEHLASAYALKGETERAAAELAEAGRLRGPHLWTIVRARANPVWENPAMLALAEKTYFAGLHKAGVPLE